MQRPRRENPARRDRLRVGAIAAATGGTWIDRARNRNAPRPSMAPPGTGRRRDRSRAHLRVWCLRSRPWHSARRAAVTVDERDAANDERGRRLLCRQLLTATQSREQQREPDMWRRISSEDRPIRPRLLDRPQRSWDGTRRAGSPEAATHADSTARLQGRREGNQRTRRDTFRPPGSSTPSPRTTYTKSSVLPASRLRVDPRVPRRQASVRFPANYLHRLPGRSRGATNRRRLEFCARETSSPAAGGRWVVGPCGIQ